MPAEGVFQTVLISATFSVLACGGYFIRVCGSSDARSWKF